MISDEVSGELRLVIQEIIRSEIGNLDKRLSDIEATLSKQGQAISKQGQAISDIEATLSKQGQAIKDMDENFNRRLKTRDNFPSPPTSYGSEFLNTQRPVEQRVGSVSKPVYRNASIYGDRRD